MMSLPVTVPPGLLTRRTIAAMRSSPAACSSSASTRATVLSLARRPSASPRSSLVISPEMSMSNTFFDPEPLISRSSSGGGRRANGLRSAEISTQPLKPVTTRSARRGIVNRLGIRGRKLYSWSFRRGKMTTWIRSCGAASLTALCVLAWAAAPVTAEDRREHIDKSNVETYKALLPEPVYSRVRDGEYVLTLSPVDPERFRANYTERFWKASAANQGRFGIDAETGGLTDAATGKIPERFFGLPFPNIQASDPQAGTKIVHNYRARRM